MNDVIPYEVVVRGDPRNGGLSLEFLQQELAELQLTPAAPTVVAHEVFIAKCGVRGIVITETAAS